jgi:hypothetical protein
MANRYEREISEILERMERTGPSRGLSQRFRRWRRRKAQGVRQGVSGVAGRWSAGRLMVIGLVLLLGALFFARFLGGLTAWLAIGGLALLIAGYVAALSQTSAHREQPNWRGRPGAYYAGIRNFSWNEILRRWRAWWRAHGIR